jgi:DNA-binding Lrp family transcriptional regulator
MSNNFLKVNKEWLSNTEFSLLEKLIVAQINEYERETGLCYMTDKQFAVAFGVSTQQVTRAMKKLADNNIIQRNTKTVSNNGQASKYRTLKAIVKSDYSLEKGIVKNEKRNSQNDSQGIVTSDYIKDNLKENIKDNLRERKIEDLSEKELQSIKQDYKGHMSYNDMKQKYNLKAITREQLENIDALLRAKQQERKKAERAKDDALVAEHKSIMDYIGSTSIAALNKCLDYVGLDITAFTDFANKHQEYSFDSYNSKRDAFGYHQDCDGKRVCNMLYKDYLQQGINASC